eukprot:6210649-Pleurochrysis_carterae.AAC.11
MPERVELEVMRDANVRPNFVLARCACALCVHAYSCGYAHLTHSSIQASCMPYGTPSLRYTCAHGAGLGAFACACVSACVSACVHDLMQAEEKKAVYTCACPLAFEPKRCCAGSVTVCLSSQFVIYENGRAQHQDKPTKRHP